MTMLDPYIGPAAGVATSVLWTGTSLVFTAAGRRIGATAVNAGRISLAIALHAVTFRLLAGTWIPDALPGQVLYLAASGIVGLSIGDQALFIAYIEIGPRLSMLVMTTAPLLAALFGWLALGEVLGPTAWLGMVLTIGGVAWVVAERPRVDPGGTAPRRVRGLVCAVIATACQAGGFLLSKQGIGHGWLPPDQHLPAQTATLFRMIFAGLGLLPIVIVHAHREGRRRKAGVLPSRMGSRRTGLALVACGAMVGPFLGVWMSLVASDRAPLAVAQTLCSLPPIFLLPFAAIIHKEHIGVRAILGAVIAVGGSAMLFLP